MNVIEYGEHCYGSYVIIDGENINQSEFDDRSDEYIRQLKLKLINELPNVVDNLSSYQLRHIAEIITQNNSDWDFDEDGSRSNKCDQCGNYNYSEVYRRINEV